MALTAAENIVIAQGLAGLSARKIASEIGYTVGTLYLVFENIDDLILQVNARTLDRLHDRMTTLQSKAANPRDYLVRMGEVYLRFADEDPHRWAMVFEHHLADDRNVPDWYQEKVMRMFAMVEEGLRPLAGKHTPQEIAQAARAIWGGVHGICILALSGTLGVTGVESVQRLTESLISNYLDGFTLGQSDALPPE